MTSSHAPAPGKPPMVVIATPTADQTVKACLANTIINATKVINTLGGRYHFAWVNSANIVFNRNKIINLALMHPDVTHILFIDSDMAIDAGAFAKLFKVGREFVGAIYPKRELDLKAYGQFRADGMAHAPALARALSFTVRLAGNNIRVTGEFIDVAGIGFGCTLIEVALLRRMIFEGVVIEDYIGESQTGVDFFTLLPTKGGAPLSEDYSFCARVLKTSGGKVWGYAGAGVGHAGEFVYQAPYLDYLGAIGEKRSD